MKAKIEAFRAKLEEQVKAQYIKDGKGNSMTNKTKHTPGPWELVESQEFLHHYRIKAMIPPHGLIDVITGDFMARKPDAELIARAPTLLTENETLRQQKAELVAMVRMLIPFSDVTTAGCAATELARDLLNRVQS